MSSKILKRDFMLFCANRYIVIVLLVSFILVLPIKNNAQWMPSLGGYGFVSNPMQSLPGYNPFANPLQGLGGYGFGVNPMQGLPGYNPFANPLQGLGGYGFGVNLMQGLPGYNPFTNPLQYMGGYGLFGSQMQYPGGYGLGVNPVIEPIPEKGLISKIKELGDGKAIQISRSDELVGYFEILVISINMVPPSIYNQYQVDTNDVVGVVKCLLDNENYSFVFVSKVKGMTDKYLIMSNDTPYSPSPTTTTFGGWPAYPGSTFYGGLFGGITGYGGLQYLGQRINEANLLPNLSSLFTGPVYGNPAMSLILGNIPLYGRPTVIPSETFDSRVDLRVDPPRSSHFNPINTGLSYSMNLMTMPFQTLIPPLF